MAARARPNSAAGSSSPKQGDSSQKGAVTRKGASSTFNKGEDPRRRHVVDERGTNAEGVHGGRAPSRQAASRQVPARETPELREDPGTGLLVYTGAVPEHARRGSIGDDLNEPYGG